MAKRTEKTVLFLCTGNYYRSRFAEVLFNSVAGKMGLPWRAVSCGLALERGINNIGPMAPSALKALEKMGLRGLPELSRLPSQALEEDFARADFIVALKWEEHQPLMQERFPLWIEKVEFWNVDDALGVLPLIEHEVMSLAARLISGGERKEISLNELLAKAETPKAKKEVSKPNATVNVGRETKGRRGKGVTLVWELPLDEAGLQELATRLKSRCGTGGTVKDGRIEIQGDQRDRITTELESLGYRVKRVGG